LINGQNVTNPYLRPLNKVILPEEISGKYLNIIDYNEPKDWQVNILNEISGWDFSNKKQEHLEYLIFGEALDWKLLAEIISYNKNGFIDDKLYKWLNFSDPLGGFNHLQIKEFTNQKVYDSIISFYYGVIVERSLIIDTQEKYYKKNIGAGIPPNEDFCDNVFTDLYNLTYSNLREDYNKNFSFNRNNKSAFFLYDENKFTYWLFKIRILNSQPEKLASDTKRGLDRLLNIKNNHFKKISNDILNNKNYTNE
tara:strand:+ start:45709 stop:46464 length:756 start_codon:yes stop_codon:yes gene_type:complete